MFFLLKVLILLVDVSAWSPAAVACSPSVGGTSCEQKSLHSVSACAVDVSCGCLRTLGMC